MSERWQRELKKLRKVGPSDEVWSRAQRGPSGEPLPPRRERIVAGAVAMSVFVAAGAFGWNALREHPGTSGSSRDQVTLRLEAAANKPKATISYRGDERSGVWESYRWCAEPGDCVHATADFAFYPPVSEFLQIPTGVSLVATGDGAITRYVVRTTGGDAASPNVVDDTDGSTLPMPTTPGRYALWIAADWGEHGSGSFYFGIEVVPPPDQIPTVLHVTCTPQTATVDTPQVRPRSDGVHIVFDVSTGVDGAEIVTGPDASSFHGVGGYSGRAWGLAPGQWNVGCYRGDEGIGPSDVGAPRTAAFTVADPNGVYTPWALACSDATTRTFGAVGDDVTAASIAAVPGILPNDDVRRAGYPAGPGFKLGPRLTVMRDGVAVATIQLPFEAAHSWTVSVLSCPGSGVGPDAPPGAAGPTPDVAVIRCSGNRTEIDTPIVNVQPDGLHVHAENLGDAVAIQLVPAGHRDEGALLFPPFAEGGGRELVMQTRPGSAQITCVARADLDAAMAGRTLDGGARMEVRDPGGFYRDVSITCARDSAAVRSFVHAVRPIDLPPTDPALAGIILESIPGLVSSDEVSIGGYSASDTRNPTWVVRRDGRVIALVDPAQNLGGDSRLFFDACKGSGIGGV